MSRKVRILLIMGIFGAFMMPIIRGNGIQESAVLKVDDDGGPGVYTIIQAAVDAASPGDTIKIMPGEYAGAWIEKPVKVMGSGPATLITSDAWDYYWQDRTGDAFDITDTAGGTEISNLAIDLSSVPPLPHGFLLGGISIFFADDVTVKDVEFRNNGYTAIYARGDGWGAKNLQIIHNSIIGFCGHTDQSGSYLPPYSAIRLDDCSNGLVAYNKIESLPDDTEPVIGVAILSWTYEAAGNSIIHNKIAVKTGAGKYAVYLWDRTGKNEVPCEDIHDNLINLNDFRGSENYTDGSLCYVAYYPECLANINMISRNLGDNRRYVPPVEPLKLKNSAGGPWVTIIDE